MRFLSVTRKSRFDFPCELCGLCCGFEIVDQTWSERCSSTYGCCARRGAARMVDRSHRTHPKLSQSLQKVPGHILQQFSCFFGKPKTPSARVGLTASIFLVNSRSSAFCSAEILHTISITQGAPPALKIWGGWGAGW